MKEGQTPRHRKRKAAVACASPMAGNPEHSVFIWTAQREGPSQDEVYVGEQSRTIRIWEEEAALASFCTHSIHTSACTLSAVTLRPEEGFAIPLGLTLGRRLCHWAWGTGSCHSHQVRQYNLSGLHPFITHPLTASSAPHRHACRKNTRSLVVFVTL